MRLSTLAADVVVAYLASGDRNVLRQYSGNRFRARFISRRWMRHAIDALATPTLTEAAFSMLRVPMLRGIAEHVFFARGSFPDVRFIERSATASPT